MAQVPVSMRLPAAQNVQYEDQEVELVTNLFPVFMNARNVGHIRLTFDRLCRKDNHIYVFRKYFHRHLQPHSVFPCLRNKEDPLVREIFIVPPFRPPERRIQMREKGEIYDLTIEDLGTLDADDLRYDSGFSKFCKVFMNLAMERLFKKDQRFYRCGDAVFDMNSLTFCDATNLILAAQGNRYQLHPQVENSSMLMSINKTQAFLFNKNVSVMNFYLTYLLGKPLDIDFDSPALERMRTGFMPVRHRLEMSRLIQGMRCVLKHESGRAPNPNAAKKTYTIHDLGDFACNVTDPRSRECINGNFERRFRVRIHFPNLPVVRLKLKNGEFTEVPMELVFISENPQRCAHRFFQMRSRNKREAHPHSFPPTNLFPDVVQNAKVIDAKLYDISRTDDAMARVGLEIKPEPIRVMGRRMPMPFSTTQIRYGALSDPYHAEDIPFVVVDLVCRAHNHDNLITNVEAILSELQETYSFQIDTENMYIIKGFDVFYNDNKNKEQKVVQMFLQQELHGFLRRNPLPFVFVVIASEDPIFELFNGYGAVKAYLDKNGFLSQVIQLKTIDHFTDSSTQSVADPSQIEGEDEPQIMVSDISYHLAMQINYKLGGVNIEIEGNDTLFHHFTKNDSVMFVAIDTRCVKPGAFVMSAAFSIDSSATRFVGYATKCPGYNNYTGEREVLRCIFDEALDRFLRTTKKLPRRMVVFRSGLSHEILLSEKGEGRLERLAIRQIVGEYMENKKSPPVKFIFIGVNRKHDVRFAKAGAYERPGEFENAVGQGNPDVGTVVDKTIVEGNDNFFLVSHRAWAGTVNPTSYIIVQNDQYNEKVRYNESQEEKVILHKQMRREIQEICFTLCTLNQRCSRSVRFPVPVVMAKIVNQRIVDQENTFTEPGELIDFSKTPMLHTII